jgi:hypothetical protein
MQTLRRRMPSPNPFGGVRAAVTVSRSRTVTDEWSNLRYGRLLIFNRDSRLFSRSIGGLGKLLGIKNVNSIAAK